MPSHRSTALIFALSARALAQSAARAGFAVHTADLFADTDTAAAAISCATIAADRQGITPASLAGALDRMGHLDPDVIVFGSGFEGRPALIDTLAAAFPCARVAGSSSTAVAAVKDPALLPAKLQADANYLAPIQPDGIIAEGGWLMKSIGGSGGTHVRVATVGERVAEGWYAQRRIAGRSMSALVLSHAGASHLIGLCGHWRGPDVDPDSFVHSGLVTFPALPDLAARAMDRVLEWGRRCAFAFDLRGLWGFDFIVDAAGRPTVVEINPRPTASMELLEGASSLFVAHVDPGAPSLAVGERPEECRASVVCYARTPAAIPADVDWPDWIADRPAAGSMIGPGSPICTVVATAATPELAVTLARDRRRRVDALLAGADGIEKSY